MNLICPETNNQLDFPDVIRQFVNPKSVSKEGLLFIKRNEVPVIVGGASLLNSKLGFGSFAIVPDRESLGIQAVSMIFDTADNDWSIEDSEIEQPISVQKVVNVNLLTKKGISINRNKLSTFDKLIN